jgi:hypothetical protein
MAAEHLEASKVVAVLAMAKPTHVFTAHRPSTPAGIVPVLSWNLRRSDKLPAITGSDPIRGVGD